MKILPPYYGSVFIMLKAPTCKGMRHIDLWRFKSMKSGKTYLVDVEQLSIPILVQKHLNTTPTNAIAHT